MAYKDTWGVTIKTEAGTIASSAYDVTGDFREGVDETVGPSTTNTEFDINIDVSAIQSMALWCDHDVTLKTNSTAAPGNTITLKAGKMLAWDLNHSDANPLTSDVTKIFVTNGDTTNSAHVKFSFLVDATP